jgi:VanZ family protein
MGKRLLHRISGPGALIWALVILFLSITPGQELPEVNFWEFDKFAHIGVYGLLVLLFGAWLSRLGQYRPSDPRFRRAALAIGIPALFGVVIEFVQGNYIPQRYFDVLDIMANIIGSISGWIAYVVAFRFHPTDQTD